MAAAHLQVYVQQTLTARDGYEFYLLYTKVSSVVLQRTKHREEFVKLPLRKVDI